MKRFMLLKLDVNNVKEPTTPKIAHSNKKVKPLRKLTTLNLVDLSKEGDIDQQLSGFFQRNNANPSYYERRQSMEETMSKFMSESVKRYKENSNMIKEIQALTDVAIQNQGASIKNFGDLNRANKQGATGRGFGRLPSSPEANLRDHVKLASTTVEADSNSIRRIESHQYALSTSLNRRLISLDPLFGDYIELNDLNVPLELRRNQVDDLLPTIKEGEVIDEHIIEIIKTRNNEDFNEYPSFCNFDQKIHIDYAYNSRFSCMIASCMEARRFDGLITIHNGSDNVTYQMARSHPRFFFLVTLVASSSSKSPSTKGDVLEVRGVPSNFTLSDSLIFMVCLFRMMWDLLFWGYPRKTPSYDFGSNLVRHEEACTITMNERCSAVLLNKLPSKEKDPGSFTIPCHVGNLHINNVLADLGASISLMPYTMYEKLGVGEPKPTRMSLELEYRPFLATARAIIDVFNKKITLRIGDDEILIAPEDQEKITFTCPYGTFSYRRMPFGLCNAPATFQLCMTTIFHDMVEDFMEVFMDDFSEKCCFMVREEIVLGHKIYGSGIEIKDKKGVENLVAYHLSRLENPNIEVLIEWEIADEFPDEHLMMLKAKLNDGEPCIAGGLDHVNHNIRLPIEHGFSRVLGNYDGSRHQYSHHETILSIVTRKPGTRREYHKTQYYYVCSLLLLLEQLKHGWIDSLQELSTLETSLKRPLSKGPHLDKECPLGEEVKQVEEVNYGKFECPAPINGSNEAKFYVGPPGYYTHTDNQTTSGEKKPKLVKTINKYMEEAAKRQAEQDEWLNFFAKTVRIARLITIKLSKNSNLR
uniref:Reverse transcriptase domain-containing protein n=1 Tax=Tanacetum cinerariifolium TaxID=118510 RepID=A0A6L2N7G9_TANCI|nr:hypothetical protein [Tanacetum cinerariifolium]